MPKKVINTGSIATGGNALNTFRTGVKIRLIIRFLPVSKPRKIPRAEPINNPVIALQIDVVKSVNNSPLFAHSMIAEKTFVGGGISTVLIAPTADNICHIKNIATIAAIEKKRSKILLFGISAINT